MVAARNNKGQFVKGQSGNPVGRPKRDVEKAYYDATVGKVSLVEWQAVVDRALVDAKGGNAEARRWLSEYLMGKPVQRTELTGEAGGPITWQQMVTLAMGTQEADGADNDSDAQASVY